MAFSKLYVASMGTGAVGVGSAGIVGWQLLSSGSSKGIPNYSLNDISLDDNPSNITFSEYGCFKKMFPGVFIDQENVSDDVTDVSSLVFPSAPVEVENNFVGCMVMKMYHDLDRLKWSLSGEVVLKGDNVSWVVWVEGFGKLASAESNSSADFLQSLEYRLVLLEKKKTEDSWDVKVSYSWYDLGIYNVNSYSDLKIYVSDPDNNIWVNVNKSNDDLQESIDEKISRSSTPLNYEYSGIWEYGEKGGASHPLQGMKIVGNEKQEGELLGRTSDFSIKMLKDNANKGRIYSLNPNDKGWKDYMDSSTDLDLSENLNSWYKPFKDKKGKWKSLSDYCLGINSSSSGKLENFCEISPRS